MQQTNKKKLGMFHIFFRVDFKNNRLNIYSTHLYEEKRKTTWTKWKNDFQPNSIHKQYVFFNSLQSYRNHYQYTLHWWWKEGSFIILVNFFSIKRHCPIISCFYASVSSLGLFKSHYQYGRSSRYVLHLMRQGIR